MRLMRRSGRRSVCTFESSAGSVCGKIRSACDDFEEKKETVRDITMAVYEFLVQEQMQEKVHAMELRFQETGELALAKGIFTDLPDRTGIIRQVYRTAR